MPAWWGGVLARFRDGKLCQELLLAGIPRSWNGSWVRMVHRESQKKLLFIQDDYFTAVGLWLVRVCWFLERWFRLCQL